MLSNILTAMYIYIQLKHFIIHLYSDYDFSVHALQLLPECIFIISMSLEVLTYAYVSDSGNYNFTYVWVVPSIITTVVVDIINIKQFCTGENDELYDDLLAVQEHNGERFVQYMVYYY